MSSTSITISGQCSEDKARKMGDRDFVIELDQKKFFATAGKLVLEILSIVCPAGVVNLGPSTRACKIRVTITGSLNSMDAYLNIPDGQWDIYSLNDFIDYVFQNPNSLPYYPAWTLISGSIPSPIATSSGALNLSPQSPFQRVYASNSSAPLNAVYFGAVSNFSVNFLAEEPDCGLSNFLGFTNSKTTAVSIDAFTIGLNGGLVAPFDALFDITGGEILVLSTEDLTFSSVTHNNDSLNMIAKISLGIFDPNGYAYFPAFTSISNVIPITDVRTLRRIGIRFVSSRDPYGQSLKFMGGTSSATLRISYE